MKRCIALLLSTLLFVCQLTACGGDATAPDPAADNNTQAPSESTGAPDSAPESNSPDTPTAAPDHDLVVGTTESVGSLDPTASGSGIGKRLVFECLFVQDPASGEIQGQLAEEWEYLDDCTLKVKLKDGVTFSNGEPLTAEDVLYSYGRYLVNTGSQTSYFTVYDFDASYCEDDQTLYLITYEPYGPGLSNLLNREIVCKDWAEGLTDEESWWSNPVGSGPYLLTENVSGSHSTYTLREDYWDTASMPQPTSITVKSYTETMTMCIDFENGDLDACFKLDENDTARLQANPIENTQLTVQTIYDTYMLCLPEYVPEFDDVRVRQAIAYSLDLDAIAEAGMGCLAFEATSILPNGVNYHIDVGSYPYDPDQARALLAEAGYGDNALSFEIVLVSNAQNQRICEAIQSYLSAVGIDLTVSSYDLPTAIGAFMKGETDLLLKETTEGAPDLEPNRILDTMLETSTNLPVKITDPEFAGYLNGALNTVDSDERAEYYRQAQEWMYENCRAIPICDKGASFAYRTDVLKDFATVSVSYPNLRFAEFVG